MPDPKFQRSRSSGVLYRHCKKDPLLPSQRNAEVYTKEAGLPKEELFPADGKIV